MPKGKIGIFLPGRNGDMMQATSVLKYKDILWPEKEIVWFCGNTPFRDILSHNDAINEIRHWPEGWKEPELCKTQGPIAIAKGEPGWADFSVLKNSDNRLDQERKHDFESTQDLDEGYFPAPWMMHASLRPGVDYPNVSRKVFGADPSWEWHPYLGFSQDERNAIREFALGLPYEKTILLETNFASGKSPWDDDLTRETMAICRNKLGACNFIFACAVDISKFQDNAGVVSCAQFTVRQTALINNYSDLFIGISSGISQAVNCWGNKPTPKLQYCGSFIMSSVSIANGPFELVVKDPKGSNPPDHENRFPPRADHRQAYKERLLSVLDRMS
jgi:hypothetical protein